ncbi:MAG: hypothetical protein FIB03_14370 [Anaerolineae bacterium]|nr:hypothetical protein [Anaerolineae bacterium]
MLLSTFLDQLYEKTLDLGRRRVWFLLLGLILLVVILINGMAIIPQQPYQELSQNPFTTRTDIHFENYWQETVLLPVIAFYLGLTSPTTFNILCFIILVGAYSLFALSSSRRWGSATALVFSTLLITSPLTTTSLTWLGTPDGLTVALTAPYLLSNSGILLFFLAILGATNHPTFIIASMEILLLRWIGRDQIKIRHLIVAAIGSAAGYGLVRLFLFVNDIKIVSRFDFILLKSLDEWVKMSAANLPMSIASLFNIHWLILLVCLLMFFKKDKLYYSAVFVILLINYAVVVFSLDTTRIFSLLSWGVLFHCIFHSHELARTEYGNDPAYLKQFLQALIVIGIASFISPRYFSWLGEIHTTPFYQFMRKLLR